MKLVIKRKTKEFIQPQLIVKSINDAVIKFIQVYFQN